MTKTLLGRAIGLAPRPLRRWLLTRAAGNRPHAKTRLTKRLQAAGLDPGYVRVAEPATFCDLEQACSNCTEGTRCSNDLERGDANDRLAAYCSNTPTIDQMTVETASPSHHSTTGSTQTRST